VNRQEQFELFGERSTAAALAEPAVAAKAVGEELPDAEARARSSPT
jgi:hypothetical protein